MLSDVSNTISHLSMGMTLEPGGIITTGTASGVGMAMKPPRSLTSGDVITAQFKGIGELTYTVS
jgi:2-keto-4-pentenoate hydratase/2-oxohepta-3-ene-1,7-dioic acid hydratase in catechol pathway